MVEKFEVLEQCQWEAHLVPSVASKKTRGGKARQE
jgi:hypothetical protein